MTTHHRSSLGKICLVFSFFLLINVISAGGHFDWRDGVETFVVTESMVIKNSAKLHADVPSIKELYGKIYEQQNLTSKPQPYYAPRSLLLSAIAVPFYYAAYYFPPLSFSYSSGRTTRKFSDNHTYLPNHFLFFVRDLRL